MDTAADKSVRNTLRKPGIHAEWEASFRTEANEEFYEEAFDYVTRILDAPPNATILDVGCGVGAHSTRLARRGFSVLGVDFSRAALKKARAFLLAHGVSEKVQLKQESVLSLSFADGSFDRILCWGVLMHIPDCERAMSELDRVLSKGGVIVISEANAFSAQSILMRGLRVLPGKDRGTVTHKPAGLERWEVTPSGTFITRQANMQWLKRWFKDRGFTIERHVAGQFTELYTRFPTGFAAKVIHGFNRIWFRHVKFPRLAFGNILILRKG